MFHTEREAGGGYADICLEPLLVRFTGMRHGYVIDSLFNEYQDKPDAYTALQSYMGVGLQAWAVQVIEQTQARISPPEFLAHAATVEQTLQDGLAQFMRYNPPMNEDEIEQLKNAQPGWTT